MKITRQKLYSILRKAGETTAQFHSTNVRGWGSWSPGVRVETARGGVGWDVSYKSYGSISTERYQEHMTRIVAALTAEGVEGSLVDDGQTYRVPVEPQQQEPTP